MSTGTRQARTVVCKIGRQHQGNVLLHDLIRFCESIAEHHAEHTGEDIRQQHADNRDARDLAKLVCAAGVLA